MKNLMTICLVVLVLGLCGSVLAETYYVATTGDNDGDGSVDNPWLTITHALNQPQVVYGDTINVAAGTYAELITLKNGVAVIGAGPSFTTIDGGAAGSVVTAIGCDADTVLEGFTITNGMAEYGGGMYNEDSNTTITSCTFSDNTASDEYSANGGGMYNIYSSTTVTNCTFTGNTASRGGGMYNYLSYSPTVANCEFSGNSAGYGGGMENAYSDTIVTYCTFSGNSARAGGGMHNYLSYSPTTVTNCTFTGNTAREEGGGMHNYNMLSPTTVTNCTFLGNSAGYPGGGGISNSGDSAKITGCEFIGNTAHRGGGMSNWGYVSAHIEPTVTNCTFSGNSAVGSGGGMHNYQFTRPIITNCIIWGNTAGENGEEISNDDLATPLISYSNIDGCGGGWTGVGPWGLDRGGNMDADPLFVDPGWWDNNETPEDPNDDIWVNGDYHLLPDSPCIDAGDNDAVPADVTTDLDGNSRIVNGFVDMGAYEYCDCEPDIDVDLLTWEFGEVKLETSRSMSLTISNTGNDDLIISTLDFTTQSTEFEIESPPLLPLEIAPEGSVEIEVVFTPSAEECYSADLEIKSNDADEPVVTVNLSGCGVITEPTPSEQIADIIAFIRDSQEDESLVGTGGQPDKKIDVLVDMIGSISDLIFAEDFDKACPQLSVILRKCDGDDTPADFVQDGDQSGATAELASMIQDLMEDLGCE
jgi:hypothetical protein